MLNAKHSYKNTFLLSIFNIPEGKTEESKNICLPVQFFSRTNFHSELVFSEIFPASVLCRDKAQSHLLTATFWDNHRLDTLLCWQLLVSNGSASFSSFRRAPSTHESGFVLFPLPNTWMLRISLSTWKKEFSDGDSEGWEIADVLK